MIYDNDWWKDCPDAAYIWTKASQGKINLRGNIVSRDMYDWQKGYVHQLDAGVKDAQSLLDACQRSGLTNIPRLMTGADAALMRPDSGVIEQTKFVRSEGSDFIVEEAKKATPQKPLLVFAGGPCTTVASAYLTDPSIADRMIVFQIDGGPPYNGADGWAWEIAEQRLFFVNWARGYFWGEWSNWDPKQFEQLPKTPLGDLLRHYANSDLGKANQWGDGAWIFFLFDNNCFARVEPYNGVGITVPQSANRVKQMEREFFQTMTAPVSKE